VEPLVSIITAACNSESTIAETIQSVIRQKYQNWEMIIVDDGSTDQSVSLIERTIAKEKRIRLIKSTTNQGPAVSRNIGLNEARGKYITFIDSDDIWLAHFLQNTIELMEKKKFPFVFASYRRISEDGSKSYGDFIVPREVSYEMLLKTNYISCLTAVYNSKIIGIRYFNTRFPFGSDYLYWLAILKDGYLAHGQKEVLALYRVRRGSVSRNKRGAFKKIWAVHRDIEGISLPRCVYTIIWYIIHGIRKNHKFIFMK
jgi:teichuronic acid biosynthesis glycosyltransferase TuaG